MFEFTPISILVGIILGVIFGILHGIFATYSSAYESNLMGDDVNDMDVNLANAMRSKLSEEDIKETLREVKMALLEADVNYKVVKEFIDGVKEEITTEAFIEAYNSYGSSLTQNGSTYEDAAKQTIQLLVNRKILINYAKNVKHIEFDEDDTKDILDQVYSSLKSSVDSYMSSVRKEWKIEEPTVKESEKEDIVVYTAYEQKAKVVKVDGEYKIELISTQSKQSTNFENIDAVKAAFNEYVNPADATDNNARIRKEAYKRLIARLKSNESGRNLSKDTKSIINRYIEKIYKGFIDNEKDMADELNSRIPDVDKTKLTQFANQMSDIIADIKQVYNVYEHTRQRMKQISLSLKAISEEMMDEATLKKSINPETFIQTYVDALQKHNVLGANKSAYTYFKKLLITMID